MKKRFRIIPLITVAACVLAGCGTVQSNMTTESKVKAVTEMQTPKMTEVPVSTTTPASTKAYSAEKTYSSSMTSFTNKYGTATTTCAHSGCTNYIASSGDTNCCTTHSKKCLECGCYIDEDATWCMKCLSKALSDTSKSSSYSSSSSSSSGGTYYCMGKNDTCPNKTNSPYDFYCSSCDPDNDNIEG